MTSLYRSFYLFSMSIMREKHLRTPLSLHLKDIVPAVVAALNDTTHVRHAPVIICIV